MVVILVEVQEPEFEGKEIKFELAGNSSYPSSS